jgi:hypothetical protein
MRTPEFKQALGEASRQVGRDTYSSTHGRRAPTNGVPHA